MVAFASSCRFAAAVVGRHGRRRKFPALAAPLRQVLLSVAPLTHVNAAFSVAAANRAAQNFAMPALSPTMTEGNITSWKLKEGEQPSRSPSD